MSQTPNPEPENLPLPGVCPPWCTQHPGHPWTSLTAVFCARDHVSEVGGIMLGGTLVHAAVIASESGRPGHWAGDHRTREGDHRPRRDTAHPAHRGQPGRNSLAGAHSGRGSRQG